MSERTILINHDGTEYRGQIGTIKSTRLGYEDHGILTASLDVRGEGWGVSVGGYCLDTPKDRDNKNYDRAGTAFGLDHIIRIIETIGVSKWEELPGTQVIVLYAGAGSIWGSQSIGVAGTVNDKVLIFKEHADSFRVAADV